MQERESLRDKLIVVTVETLIIGAFLVGLGYWINLRLEAYKQELVNQSDRTKTLVAALEPLTQQRRTAYLEFLQAAREAKVTLDVYYGLAPEFSEQHAALGELKSIQNRLGAGSGSSSSSWTTHEEAIDVVKKLISLREKYQDVASEETAKALDEFIAVIMGELKKASKDSVKLEEDAASGRRIDEAFLKFRGQIAQALGLAVMPIR